MRLFVVLVALLALAPGAALAQTTPAQPIRIDSLRGRSAVVRLVDPFDAATVRPDTGGTVVATYDVALDAGQLLAFHVPTSTFGAVVRGGILLTTPSGQQIASDGLELGGTDAEESGLYRIEVRGRPGRSATLQMAAFTPETIKKGNVAMLGTYPELRPDGQQAATYALAWRVAARAGGPLLVLAESDTLAMHADLLTPERFEAGQRALSSHRFTGRVGASSFLALPAAESSDYVLVVSTEQRQSTGGFRLFVLGVDRVTSLPQDSLAAWDARVQARLAQDDTCAPLVADLTTGRVNGLPATATMDEVKAALPCFTGESEESSAMNYGGGVFFLNHNVYAYTGADRWEMRDGFRGRTEPDVLGLPLAAALARLEGMGTAVSAGRRDMPWGCLDLRPDRITGTNVGTVQMHAKACAEVED